MKGPLLEYDAIMNTYGKKNIKAPNAFVLRLSALTPGRVGSAE